MPTIRTYKQLAQRLPTTTSAALLYKVPNQQTIALIKNIQVCNVTGSSATYSIYVNQGGSTVADSFAIKKTFAIAANTTQENVYIDDTSIALNGDNLHPNAQIIVSASTGSALNFTLYGYEVVQT